MANTGLSRKEKERLRHREEILAVALRLFSESGFQNVSMQEIARESEFSVGALYNFFKNKESLFRALMKSCALKISDILTPILEAQTETKEKVSSFIKAHKQIIEDHAPTISLYLTQDILSSLTARRNVDSETDAVREAIHRKLSDIFRAGIQQGIFRDIHPKLATLSLSAMLESLIFTAIKNPGQVAAEDGIREIEGIFFQGVLR